MFERLGRAQQLHRPIDGASAFPERFRPQSGPGGGKTRVYLLNKPLAKDAVRIRVARILFSAADGLACSAGKSRSGITEVYPLLHNCPGRPSWAIINGAAVGWPLFVEVLVSAFTLKYPCELISQHGTSLVSLGWNQNLPTHFVTHPENKNSNFVLRRGRERMAMREPSCLNV